MGIQVIGNGGVVADVDSNSRALRVAVRPVDVAALGHYSISSISGTMAAGLAASAPIFSMRWSDATRLCLIRDIRFSAAVAGTAFAATVPSFALARATSFSASDTGGADVVPPANMEKRRTSFGNSLFAASSCRIATTATLTAGTRTLDSFPLAIIVGNAGAATTGQIIPPGTALWAPLDNGEYPLTLAQNEGIIILATVPATGTWTFAVSVNWTEIAAF